MAVTRYYNFRYTTHEDVGSFYEKVIALDESDAQKKAEEFVKKDPRRKLVPNSIELEGTSVTRDI